MKHFNALYSCLASLLLVFSAYGMDQSSLDQSWLEQTSSREPRKDVAQKVLNRTTSTEKLAESLRDKTIQWLKLNKIKSQSNDTDSSFKLYDLNITIKSSLKTKLDVISNQLSNNKRALTSIENIINSSSLNLKNDILALKQGLDTIHFSRYPLLFCKELRASCLNMYNHETKEFDTDSIENIKGLLAARGEIDLGSKNEASIKKVIGDLEKKVSTLLTLDNPKTKKYIVTEVKYIIDVLCDGSMNEVGKKLDISGIVKRIIEEKNITTNGKISILRELSKLPDAVLAAPYKDHVKLSLADLKKKYKEEQALSKQTKASSQQNQESNPDLWESKNFDNEGDGQDEDLFASGFYPPSQADLLETLTLITNDIVENLTKLSIGPKNVMQNLDSIKTVISNLIDVMYKQIQQIEEEIPVNSRRLLELRQIQRSVKNIGAEQIINQDKKTNIFLQYIEKIKKIEQITINNIKNKSAALELGSSGLQLQAITAKPEIMQKKKERQPLVEKLKKEDLALKALKETKTISAEYIELAKEHIATLQKYSLMITQYEPKLKRSIEGKIKENIENLDLMMKKMYRLLPYPSVTNPSLLVTTFSDINAAIISANRSGQTLSSLLNKVIESFGQQSRRALPGPQDELAQNVSALKLSLIRVLSQDDKNIVCTSIPFLLNEMYQQQINAHKDDIELIQLTKNDLNELFANLTESAQALNQNIALIKAIINQGQLDQEKMQACLMLLNKKCTFYPNIKSSIAETIIDNIAFDYYFNLKKPDENITETVKMLTSIPVLEPLFVKEFKNWPFSDKELKVYREKIEHLEKNSKLDIWITMKLKEISDEITAEIEKRLAFATQKNQSSEQEISKIAAQEQTSEETPKEILEAIENDITESPLLGAKTKDELPERHELFAKKLEEDLEELNKITSGQPEAVKEKAQELKKEIENVAFQYELAQVTSPLAPTSSSVPQIAEKALSAENPTDLSRGTSKKITSQKSRVPNIGSREELETQKEAELKAEEEKRRHIKEDYINDLREKENAQTYLQDHKLEILKNLSNDDYNDLRVIAKDIEKGKAYFKPREIKKEELIAFESKHPSEKVQKGIEQYNKPEVEEKYNKIIAQQQASEKAQMPFKTPSPENQPNLFTTITTRAQSLWNSAKSRFGALWGYLSQ